MRWLVRTGLILLAVPAVAQTPANSVEARMRQAMPADAECSRDTAMGYSICRKETSEWELSAHYGSGDLSLAITDKHRQAIQGSVLNDFTERAGALFATNGFTTEQIKECVENSMNIENTRAVVRNQKWLLACQADKWAPGRKSEGDNSHLLVHVTPNNSF